MRCNGTLPVGGSVVGGTTVCVMVGGGKVVVMDCMTREAALRFLSSVMIRALSFMNPKGSPYTYREYTHYV